MGRSEIRQHIFKMLFVIEFNDREELEEQIGFYFDNVEELSEENKRYMKEKVEAVADRLEEIDQLINECSKGWRTTRMNRVDLTLLRLATYEIKWDEEVPTGVAINEAVELAKKYSSDEGPSFINGILAKIAN